ncbi:hypothetical protein L3Y34_017337 [Caenorhabditis briggsae]|uniref:Uncharacterized protein n=1 Tax=Caenorhabditis briggsae TaxID=6238 RepID=A0AAE9IT90_CAEBR|nr:hypothetical protein L3Y34_017337 [Caenorhabditis briggsae]
MDKSWAVGSNESPITRGRRKAAEEAKNKAENAKMNLGRTEAVGSDASNLTRVQVNSFLTAATLLTTFTRRAEAAEQDKRFTQCSKELEKLLQEDRLSGAPLLLLANKCDLPAPYPAFLIFRGSGKRDLVRFLTAVRSPANFWCKR